MKPAKPSVSSKLRLVEGFFFRIIKTLRFYFFLDVQLVFGLVCNSDVGLVMKLR